MENLFLTSRRQRALKALPFAAVALISFAVLPAELRENPPTTVVAAGLLSAAIFSTIVFCPWSRIPRAFHNIPVLLSLGVVALLYMADGGANSGYGLLALIPVVLMLLSGSRTELIIAIVGATAVVGLPHLANDVTYAENEPRRIALFIAVIGLLGLIIRQLVSDLAQRSRMAEERSEALAVAERRMAEQAMNLAMVVEVTREFATLSDSELLRRRICKAATELARAEICMLFEPNRNRDALRITAGTVPEMIGHTVKLVDDRSGAVTSFQNGARLFASKAEGHPLLSSHLVKAMNAKSALFQPILQDGAPIGVLAIVWQEPTPALTERLTSLTELLATEAANSIERANLLAKLADLARTDELTGLPNRREWETALGREMDRAQRSGAPLTVAMIDLDLFKNYNDRYGHQAGDRLLKLAAASWQNELRSTDVLARYGGEEFVLALGGCDLELAGELADRMRQAMPEGETCSIGIAQWNGSEGAESLVKRADQALYKAKAGGRDRVTVANWLPPLRSVS